MTDSRGVGVSSEWRVRSRRSRPIGASIRPDADLRRAAHERGVRALELARADQLLQEPVRLGRAGHDEQPGRVAVEPVDDPGPVVVVSSLGAVREQSLHERSGPRRPCGMDDEAGGLVDDEQVLVLPDDRDVQRLRLQLRRARGSRR